MIPDTFNRINITDTCAVWHLIGADSLFRSARGVNVTFVITPTVFYECFVKAGGRPLTAARQALQERLRAHLDGGQVTRADISIDDLQATVNLAKRRDMHKRIGQGELSCAALARRLGHPAVLTDNKRDFKAIGVLVEDRVQTTPRLLGWLYVEGHIIDSDVDKAIQEHEASDGQMAPIYRKAHRLACEKRLAQQIASRLPKD